ncbi:glycoside hydrolase family 16 protein [Piloderma croceum F 1598]|uniref:Glycoside hydrolase family 16 protein n=1 Tax=Piloderma croceum (strain F 1598) TaxID=765440 RepID=A0A0C3G1W7_PILCF|nr:glycoside hydrolase family 16 protein [Piloderma croceum F 1598]
MPKLIDTLTPDSAKTCTGFDGNSYDLVFSDEFKIDNRTFYPGDNPYCEACTSTDGTWPYTYNSCDVGTFPNQSLKDGSGPSAAIHSDASKTKYDFRLSYLPGQSCS